MTRYTGCTTGFLHLTMCVLFAFSLDDKYMQLFCGLLQRYIIHRVLLIMLHPGPCIKIFVAENRTLKCFEMSSYKTLFDCAIFRLFNRKCGRNFTRIKLLVHL